jgi:hypothetical protein
MSRENEIDHEVVASRALVSEGLSELLAEGGTTTTLRSYCEHAVTTGWRIDSARHFWLGSARMNREHLCFGGREIRGDASSVRRGAAPWDRVLRGLANVLPDLPAQRVLERKRARRAPPPINDAAPARETSASPWRSGRQPSRPRDAWNSSKSGVSLATRAASAFRAKGATAGGGQDARGTGKRGRSGWPFFARSRKLFCRAAEPIDPERDHDPGAHLSRCARRGQLAD